jgi:hypothetical protein
MFASTRLTPPALPISARFYVDARAADVVPSPTSGSTEKIGGGVLFPPIEPIVRKAN